MVPAASRFVDAMVKWPASEEPSQTAFNVVTGLPGSFYEEMAKSPARAEKFANAMSFFQTMPGLGPSQIVDAYDWASLGEAVVVDVGGSNGSVASEIVQAFPHIRAVVQDLPEVVGNPHLAEKINALERVTFQAHDFFREQKLNNVDVFLFRMILHDWSDTYCVRILRNFIPAVRQGAKILINDLCLPDPGTVPRLQEQNARYVTRILT